MRGGMRDSLKLMAGCGTKKKTRYEHHNDENWDFYRLYREKHSEQSETAGLSQKRWRDAKLKMLCARRPQTTSRHCKSQNGLKFYSHLQS